jgi:hypothetical protein
MTQILKFAVDQRLTGGVVLRNPTGAASEAIGLFLFTSDDPLG